MLKIEFWQNDSSEKAQSEKVRIWDLFRRPLMRLLCFNVMFSWFTVSMVFYGLALNGGNLAGDFIIRIVSCVSKCEVFKYIRSGN